MFQCLLLALKELGIYEENTYTVRRDPQGAIRKKPDDENQGQIVKKKVEIVVEEEEAGAEMTEDVENESGEGGDGEEEEDEEDNQDEGVADLGEEKDRHEEAEDYQLA